MRILSILIFVLVSLSFQAHGQTHELGEGYNCRYKKKSAGSVDVKKCPACSNEKEKEEQARVEENKRQQELAIQNKKAVDEQKKREWEERQKQLAEEQKKYNENSVVIQNPSNLEHDMLVKKEIKSGNGVYLWGSGKVIYNTLDFLVNLIYATPLFVDDKNLYTEFDPVHTTFSNYLKSPFLFDGYKDSLTPLYEFPKNCVIAVLNKTIDQTGYISFSQNNRPSKTYNVFDLCDQKGKRFFNADSVSFIGHFYSNWFLVGTHFFNFRFYDGDGIEIGKPYLYNIKTKQSINLNNESYYRTYFYESGRRNDDYVVLGNPDYSTGKYVESNGTRDHNIKLFDTKTGGRQQWKAAIAQGIQHSSDINNTTCLLYYIDKDDQIKSIEITFQELSYSK